MKAPHKKELQESSRRVFLAISWKADGWPKVEGVFEEEDVARGLAVRLKRDIGVAPLEINRPLPDLDDWPGAYYVRTEEL